jgi:cob(I)alamin adenosyltransferase
VTAFYTRSGDKGYTSVIGKGRYPKFDPKLEAVGTLDEVTAVLGLARSMCQSLRSKEILLRVQRDLYSIMTEVATTTEEASKIKLFDAGHVTWLEEQIDSLTQEVKLPKGLIVPGDSPAGAFLDLARTIVRRAERRLVELFQLEGLPNPELLKYINRLSSLCFILELFENHLAGNETPTLMRLD